MFTFSVLGRVLPVCARVCVVASAVIGGLLCRWAGAQCTGWRAVAGNTDAELVFASTTWDPDGAGPAPARLVVGGRFGVAGWLAGGSTAPVAAANIASFDGSGWSGLGVGLSGDNRYALVQSVVSYNNALYAGGGFDNTGGTPLAGLARWTGTAWSAVGGGLWSPDPGTGAPSVWVLAMTVYNGELVVAGEFQRVNGSGGTVVNNIARWNGSTWQAMGGGSNGQIGALAVHNGELYAGGTFSAMGGVAASRIARWDASAGVWRAVGVGIDLNDTTATSVQDSVVYSLASYGGSLVAAGRFSGASGVAAHDIARWNGSGWAALGEGLARPHSDPFYVMRRGVYALGVYNGQLIAAGEFQVAGGQPALNIASWNGSAWSALGPGLGTVQPAYGDESGRSLTVYNNRLYVGGIFSSSGLVRYAGLGQWDGSSVSWVPTAGVLRAVSPGVRALVPWEGSMTVGGDFGFQYQPGFLPWNWLRWNGLGFSPTSLSPTNGTNFGVIHAAFAAPASSPPSTTNLYLGGDFTSFTSFNTSVENLNRVVRLNSLVAGFQPMGSGFNNTVRSITSFNGAIYAAGDFTGSGAGTVSHIARWTGSAWQGVTSQPTPGPEGLNGPVLAMRGYTVNSVTARLVVGGAFTSAGGVAVSNVAAFSQGTVANTASWVGMGAGFNNTVRALEYYNGSIYAGGDFTASGATPLNHLARWTGTAWVDVGGGVSGPVYALKVSNSTLVVGGSFAAAGGLPATTNLARWNGTGWSPIDAGTNGPVLSLASFQNELHVGGQFTAVGSPVKYTMGYARYLETGVPWFAGFVQMSGSQCPGSNFSVTGAIAEGYDNLSPQWRKDGVPLTEGFTPWGSYISGAQSLQLDVLGAYAGDSGSYDLVVSSPCGSVTSGATVVSIPVCDCVDFNNDGLFPDAFDIVEFLAVFSGGPCSTGSCNDIDFNNDGLFPDTLDIDALLSVFAGGPCL
ncbi:MAG: hypothetical protein U0637_02340 [Phycisphaerales bacterium]